MNKDEVIIKYDLAHMPVTYDSAYYLTNAALMLKHSGYEHFVIWVKSGDFRERTERDLQMPKAEKNWRLENLIVPVCNRLINCIAVVTMEHKPLIGVPIFPDDFELSNVGYTAAFTGYLHKLTGITPVQFDASDWAKRKVSDRLGNNGADAVSITLRHSKYFSHRNTATEIVSEMAGYFAGKGKRLLVIPDSESAFEVDVHLQTKNVLVLPEVAASLDLRLAVYQWCGLNIGPSNGPVAMSFLTKNIRMLQFDLLKSDHTGNGVQKGWEQTNGFPVGENFPWAENGSRLCWDDLNLQNVQRQIEVDENPFS